MNFWEIFEIVLHLRALRKEKIRPNKVVIIAGFNSRFFKRSDDWVW